MIQMIIIMIISGLLSSMSVWADKANDMRLSINDIYMIVLMTAWMTFLMSVLHKNTTYSFISGVVILATYYAIREQLFINIKDFYRGMIPHHSMALLMSKRVLEKEGLTKSDRDFAKNIIKTQSAEIEWMKTTRL
jgi:hypothetical protein